ncbi:MULTISPECIES: MFS transporter [unclassified Solwaraspora]|uniref:MFS transporter n=1 Tax=unclassified Solwaraspora TaxID=2627926 RepID=UPI00259B63F0|nr:MFS transporter [Solwaraspora sp. WMMA2056]WJK43124.1 MFS transporter [Solwaraspora sp. WMMA2056]
MEAPSVSDETHHAGKPATFRDVFAVGEFRFLFASVTLSWAGDYIAKAAVTVLVYRQTQSVALSAAAFAVSFLPWLIGGPLLTTVAERYPYHRVMITTDLIRMVLIALVAIPGLPVWAMLGLLFCATLASPPNQAARSALIPTILTGDRLIVGLSVNASTSQLVQVGGYVAGAAVAAVNPRAALLLNAATFALSALVVRLGIRARPATTSVDGRQHLLRETAEGFRLVWGTDVLRAIAVLVWTVPLFAIVPEGLAAAWAAEWAAQPGVDDADRGLAQAMIMAASPTGYILGGLLIGRFVRPDRRSRLIRPFAVLAPLVLAPVMFDPSPVVVAALAAVCGFAVAGLLPVTNGLFVRALPQGYRARAFGVVATGMQVSQGTAVLLTGVLADRFDIPTVVGLWSLAGAIVVSLALLRWPDAERFDAAAAAVAVAETTTPPTAGATGSAGSGPTGSAVGRLVPRSRPDQHAGSAGQNRAGGAGDQPPSQVGSA